MSLTVCTHFICSFVSQVTAQTPAAVKLPIGSVQFDMVCTCSSLAVCVHHHTDRSAHSNIPSRSFYLWIMYVCRCPGNRTLRRGGGHKSCGELWLLICIMSWHWSALKLKRQKKKKLCPRLCPCHLWKTTPRMPPPLPPAFGWEHSINHQSSTMHEKFKYDLLFLSK